MNSVIQSLTPESLAKYFDHMIAVLAFNFLGDGLRDVLDTKRLS